MLKTATNNPQPPFSSQTSNQQPPSPVIADKNPKGEWQVERFHGDYTPTFGWVWVFGSTLAGRHQDGSEKIARVNFRAEYGNGNGPTGRAYAIPTRCKHAKSLDCTEVKKSIAEFVDYAGKNLRSKFFVSHIIASGMTDADFAEAFRNAPSNCTLPSQWNTH